MIHKNIIASKSTIKLMKLIENFKQLSYEINRLIIYSSMFLTYSLVLEEKKYSKYFKDFKYFLLNKSHLNICEEFYDNSFIKYLYKFKLKSLDLNKIVNDLDKNINKHIVYIVFNPSINDINIINEKTYLKEKYKHTFFIYVLNKKVLNKLNSSNIENYERI